MGIVRRIFVAEGRARLFWRVFGFFIAFMTFQGISVLSYPPQEGVGPSFVRAIVQTVVRTAGIVGIVALFRRYVDKRPWRAMKLDSLRGRILSLVAGWIVGAVLIVVLFALELGAGWIHVVGYEHTTGGTGRTAVYLLEGFLGCASAGITEETAVRGYVFQNLGERLPLWLATLIAGLVFGVMHVVMPGFSPMFVVAMVVMTALLVLSRLLTGSLWWAIGWHWSWDFVQSSVLGISAATLPDHDHALLHLTQSGPALLVGKGALIEGGLASWAVELLGFLALALWARWAGLAVPWRGKLDEDDGDPVAAGPAPPAPAAQLGAAPPA
jgi:membrane protease YdiL (CAAX protease family)